MPSAQRTRGLGAHSRTGLRLGFAPRVVQHVNIPAPPERRLAPSASASPPRPGEGTPGGEGARAGLRAGLPAPLAPAHVPSWAPHFLDLNLQPPSASALPSLMVAEGLSAGSSLTGTWQDCEAAHLSALDKCDAWRGGSLGQLSPRKPANDKQKGGSFLIPGELSSRPSPICLS